MIVLKSPKGWTGPKFVDGLQIESTFRSHQVPLLVDPEHPDHVKLLESWMKSYRAEELFDQNGRLLPELAELAPKGDRRMGAILTPTAAFCSAICACRTSMFTR
jgi:xylulose-5-phosphate/fructose-6-phosphate phosphoketolase